MLFYICICCRNSHNTSLNKQATISIIDYTITIKNMKKSALKRRHQVTKAHSNAKTASISHVKKSHYGWKSLQKYFTLNATIPFTILAVLYLCYDQFVDDKSSQQADVSDTVPVISQKSLLVPFTLDHKELLRKRSRNIEKWRRNHQWKVSYNENGIDRRSNLSLQEFWDVYDGIW